MSDLPKPDPVVREKEARASVEELTKGFAADAHANGLLPPIRQIEEFAQEVTREQIARHEERFRNGVPDPKSLDSLSGSPARIDRGAYEDDLGTVEKVERAFDPKRHAAKTAARKIPPPAEIVESRLVDMRMKHLLQVRDVNGSREWVFPEWATRIHKAYSETLALSKTLELPDADAKSNAADAVLRVLDQSNATFGDWRHPKAPNGQPLHFIVGIKHGE